MLPRSAVMFLVRGRLALCADQLGYAFCPCSVAAASAALLLAGRAWSLHVWAHAAQALLFGLLCVAGAVLGLGHKAWAHL